MRIAPALSLLLLLLSAAVAAAPDDYGYRWSVNAEAASSAHRIVLTEEVYRRVGNAGLRDLEAFDANGQSLPFGPLAARDGTTVSVSEQQSDLPWFPLPEPARAESERVDLHVTRDAQGRLRQLDASVVPNAVKPSPSFVLDASALGNAPVEALTFEWPEPGAPGFSLRVRVSASSDLGSWRTLVPEARLIDLRQGVLHLIRRGVELPAEQAPYLRVDLLDPGATLAIARVSASVRARTTVAPARLWAAAQLKAQGERPQFFDFRAPGPMPIERVAITPGSDNAVSEVEVMSRDRADAPWQSHGRMVVFRLGGQGEAAGNEALSIAPVRNREWRLVANPPLAAAPTVKFGYRPDEFVLMAAGPARYVLAAGSATVRRPDYPVEVVLAELRSRNGHDWQVPQATLGPLETVRGEAAMAPPVPPKPVKLWLLWGALLVGVVSIGWMVLKLLQESK